MELLEALKWRYATKKFDKSKKVDQELVDKIVEAAWLAPTSSGLQPFEIFVITNQELKDKMLPVSFSQSIVTECSHLLVFAAWDNYTTERIDHIYSKISSERGQDPNHYKPYTDKLKSMYLNRPSVENFEHAARQTYIALAFSMAEAASLKVDATPMEGFVAEEVDRLLNLGEKGLKSVTLLPIGYRDETNDWLAPMKKVRHHKSKFVTTLD